MGTFQTVVTYGGGLIALLLVLVPAIQKFVDLFPNHQEADTWFGKSLRVLEFLSGILAPRPAKNLQVRKPIKPTGAAVALLLGGLILSGVAHAETYVSAGASLPVLEFQTKGGQPVYFAPGLGVEGSLGWFQTEIFGNQWDLLNVSANIFANSPGALQVALTIGTLNDLISVGVALPLTSSAGNGVFQGGFQAYPVLGLNIPVIIQSLTQQPPPGTLNEIRNVPRGATIYF